MNGNTGPGGTPDSGPEVVSIILSRNSYPDVRALLPQLYRQRDSRHGVVVVDNASEPSDREALLRWMAAAYPHLLAGPPGEIEESVARAAIGGGEEVPVALVLMREDSGDSAGNNAGIRVAEALGARAVLLLKPGIRIVNDRYVWALSSLLFDAPDNLVVASRILGRVGHDLNPLREARFLEELLWPMHGLLRYLRRFTLVPETRGTEPVIVEKVSGRCLMARMSFLRDTGYLDEGVFRYNEESILAAKVRRRGGRILYLPGVLAVHRHLEPLDGDGTAEALQAIASRRYYLGNYSGYARWKLALLALSYRLLGALYKLRLR